MKSVITAAVAILLPFGAVKSQKIFKDWPLGTDPAAIGSYVANHFAASQYDNFGSSAATESITYPDACTWYGALKFARATRNKDLLEKLAGRFDPLLAQSQSLIPKPDHVDHSVFGIVPIELYLQTNQSRYLSLGQPLADQQWDMPETIRPEQQKYSNQGLSWQSRMWIDDTYLITILQIQAFRATANKKYIENATNEMVAYLGLQQANGLFYHAQDAPFLWGRGNGWAAAGLTELLTEIPIDNPNRPRILEAYKKMMAGLKAVQDKNYMWHQLLDEPDAWAETSCSGMFTYAMIVGVKKGWLDEKEYGPIARNSWINLVKYINEAGDIKEVCEGTNKKNDKQYYLDRNRVVGDLHGQAPILWCAYALLSN
jgi:unsaturated rhamnogalacturonyl hydrolase